MYRKRVTIGEKAPDTLSQFGSFSLCVDQWVFGPNERHGLPAGTIVALLKM